MVMLLRDDTTVIENKGSIVLCCYFATPRNVFLDSLWVSDPRNLSHVTVL